MRRGSGKAKDRGWGSAGRGVGGRSRGPASRKGPQRVAGCGERGELSAQHRRPPHQASEGGIGALQTQAARAPAGSSATASWTPGQPPPLRPPERPQRRRGPGNELTQLGWRQEQLRTPALVFPEAAKLWVRPTGSQPPHASLRGLGR